MFLRYNELRLLMADQSALDARDLVGDRRDEREDAFEKRPPSWVGTATEDALGFPYNALWGFPEKFHAGEPATTGEVKGLAASPGVVEGPARYVTSLDEFDQVKRGRHPRLPHDQPGVGGAVHQDHAAWSPRRAGRCRIPAVVAREFGIPAVVGTTNAGERITTGDRVRVNGTHRRRRDSGVSARSDRAGSRPRQPARRRSTCAPSAATRRPCSPAGRSWASS